MTKIVVLFLYLALIKAFSLLFVNFISNYLLPTETNVLGNCITFIHNLRTVDQKGYFTFWWWTKTNLNFFLSTGRQLTVYEKGYVIVFFPCNRFRSRDLLITSGFVVWNVYLKLIRCVAAAVIYSWLENNTGKFILKLHI